jgi:hypothetical protein
MTKGELLDTLQAEYSRWEALLEQVGPARMERPGVTEDWAVKDIVGHLAAWQSRPVAWFQAARAGTRPEPPPWDMHLSEEEINAWITQSNRSRPLQDLLAESRRVSSDLLEAIRATPEQELADPGRFPWLQGRSLLDALAGNTYEHYQEHGQAIRAWLEKEQA